MTEVPYEQSLANAEAACFRALCAATGFAPGKNAYLGVNPGNPDCLVFDAGASQTAALNAFAATVAHFRAQADFYARDRAALQRLVMRVRRLLPTDEEADPLSIREGSCVVQFRLAPEAGNPSALKTAEVQTARDERPVPTWTASAVFDLVFLTPR